jgi:hypothetical protein
MGSDVTVLRTIDNGATWQDLRNGAGVGNLPTSGDAFKGFASDGTNVWTMAFNTGVSTVQLAGGYSPATFPGKLAPGVTVDNVNIGRRWLTTPFSGDGSTWTETGTQSFQDGPQFMYFEAATRTLYSANWSTGVFRMVLP